ncbi:hypothetical protein SDC9_125936 [bioreactor metagenome]|uniref:Uncharacterized protein n=1 Tax=bioreactor metagenome TaxID=1076179 RepID=A0A645CPT5_9ZZZZ
MIGDLVAIDIGHQFGLLADAQIGELAFLEVGVHPEVVQIDHRHQRRARSHALA